jgi:hypothetical protein
LSPRPAGCPAGYTAADWRALAAHRAEMGAPEPAGWAAALEHLALERSHGCAACRSAAVAADPTLVFGRLRTPGLQAPAPAMGDDEVLAVQQAVAALRVASRLGVPAPAAGLVRRSAGWMRPAARWAAAAGLAAALLAGAGSAGPRRMAPAALSAAAPLAPFSGAAVPVAMRAAAPASQGQMPMLEELDRPDARVYQLDGSKLSVVMIVDGNLDV